MQTTFKIRKDIAVITVGSSSLDNRLATVLRRAIQLGRANVLLDLGRLTYLDSHTLGELLMYKELAQRGNGDLKLLNPSGRVRQMLDTLSLDVIFDVFDDEAEALDSFPKLPDDQAADAAKYDGKLWESSEETTLDELVEIYSGYYEL